MNVLKYFQILEMNDDDPKEYKASLWVRKDEAIMFAIRFKSGSHIEIALTLDGESNCQCKFPFRYNDIIYYGCTTDMKCASKVDGLFNTKEEDLISCNEPATNVCPIQGESKRNH